MDKNADKDVARGKVRLDKWLWAARFYKTRGLAHEAIEGGRVYLNGARVKPGKTVEVNQVLEIRSPRGDYTITVKKLSEKRVSASLAQEMFEEHEASKLKREHTAELRRLSASVAPEERPNTQDRRLLRKIKEGGL